MTKTNNIGRGRRFEYNLLDIELNTINTFTCISECCNFVNEGIPENCKVTLASLNQMMYRNKTTLSRGVMKGFQLTKAPITSLIN
tara:strand:+ start:174 stop:428 length:255 start_codon:yes stop_codon:yes gene_type:complete